MIAGVNPSSAAATPVLPANVVDDAGRRTRQPREQCAPTGAVRCENIRGRSVLTRLYSRNPIKFLSPGNVGHASRVVMSSFGGGMVAGDDVTISIDVARDAACVFTSQSSGKIYRSDGRTCSQQIDANIDDGAILLNLPDPLYCFAGASYEQRQTFNLNQCGNLVSMDWLGSGRWARDERWAFDSYRGRTDVLIDGRLAVRESLLLNSEDGHLAGPMRMSRFDSYIVLMLFGPRLEGLIADIERRVNDLPLAQHADLLASVSKVTGGAIVRVLGPGVQPMQDFVRPMLALLTHIIGEDPLARKW